jgi:hypothetical protein
LTDSEEEVSILLKVHGLITFHPYPVLVELV